MSRNTDELNKIVYTALKSDVTLLAALGGSASKIKHAGPMNLSEYPCLTYKILQETDNAYNSDQKTDITNSYIITQVFSANTSPKEAYTINDAVFGALDGKSLSNAKILVYIAHRQSTTPVYEPTVKVWRVDSTYKLTNVVK